MIFKGLKTFLFSIFKHHLKIILNGLLVLSTITVEAAYLLDVAKCKRI